MFINDCITINILVKLIPYCYSSYIIYLNFRYPKLHNSRLAVFLFCSVPIFISYSGLYLIKILEYFYFILYKI